MSETIRDETAREMARAAEKLALKVMGEIAEHRAVCGKIDEARKQFNADMREWMERIQDAYKTGLIDLRAIFATEFSSVKQDHAATKETQRKINIDLYNRFWVALVGWGTLMTGISGYLLIRFVLKG